MLDIVTKYGENYWEKYVAFLCISGSRAAWECNVTSCTFALRLPVVLHIQFSCKIGLWKMRARGCVCVCACVLVRVFCGCQVLLVLHRGFAGRKWLDPTGRPHSLPVSLVAESPLSSESCPVRSPKKWRWNEFESGGTSMSQSAGKIFWVVPLHFFGSKSTISRFCEHFRDGQYSLTSFLFAVLLLTVPPVPCYL